MSMTQNLRHMSSLLLVLPVFCAVFVPGQAMSQTRLLDDFEILTGWTPIVSDGAHLTLAQGPGVPGSSLAMQFDLRGASGYCIAQKEFSIDLPADFQFVFDMRADAPVNNFEFKVIDDHDNVFWIKKLNITYPREWIRQRVKKRHLHFAWGPVRDAPLRRVRKIEFVVSAGTGGTGTVSIDNFRFEMLDTAAASAARPRVRVRPAGGGRQPRFDRSTQEVTGWKSPEAKENALTLDFGYAKELGGLVLEWDKRDFATAYDVQLSDDTRQWRNAYTVTEGNGGKDYVPLPETETRSLRLVVHHTSRSRGVHLATMWIKGPEFSASPNALFRSIAADALPGDYPKEFLDTQTYWTVTGVDGDTREALINEQGMIEVDKQQFVLEPFLFVDGRLVTWHDVTTTPSLRDGYLPIPSVTWDVAGRWRLDIEAVAAGTPGTSVLGVRYALTSTGGSGVAKLFVAIRPFQVNPPWQFLNVEGGTSRIDSIRFRNGLAEVNNKVVVPVTPPTAFGASPFTSGDIIEYLRQGIVPLRQETIDLTGFASAALQYTLRLSPGERREIVLAVPFHAYDGNPAPALPSSRAGMYYSRMVDSTVSSWERALHTVQFTVPPVARPVINTYFSNLAYILINRDGPGIQPGSRNYERSWIRDGALTCTALLQSGHTQEVREFLDWYARGQFPNGKIPCVIDARGPDPVPEHDSNGEFIYALLQYYRYTHDSLWLRGKFDAVVRTVGYIQSLRAERKTAVYKNGTPEQRALYGLVPESISHEGYSDVPRHSYWDDFFVLRGLKDAATMAEVLGESAYATAWAVERDDFRHDLYASMRQAMKNTGIDYIPGCAELGDFDATSTTIGIAPGGELGAIPEPELHNTFDKYFTYFQERKRGETGPNYTPYETRIVGSFVYLGQRDRVEETLEFFMNDRRPPAWNHWAEVVWRDPATPKFIGDMPHTWVGSDFVRSVRALFVYERERDSALVIGAGIPLPWVADSTGIGVARLPTYYGTVGYTMRRTATELVTTISDGPAIPPGGIVVIPPMALPARRATVDGAEVPLHEGRSVTLWRVPAVVRFEF